MLKDEEINLLRKEISLLNSKNQELESEKRIANIIFNSHEGIAITDSLGNIIKTNIAFTEITGYSEEDVLGKNPNILSSGKQNKIFYQNIWEKILTDNFFQGEIWNKRKNKEVYPEWINISAVRNSENKVTNFVASFSDISKNKESKESIYRLAYFDPLTNLPNRRLLDEKLHAAINPRKNQFAVMMLDIDHFKSINDNYGHKVGDELLKEVGVRISSSLRIEDIVARLGGDEFVIVLDGIRDSADASYIAKKIINDFKIPIEIQKSVSILVTVSIGISLYPDHGSVPEILMDNADSALYQAKDAGRNCFAYFSQELSLDSKNQIQLEIRLRQALVNKEFVLFYQPQIDIKTGLMIGVEALVRWIDPVQGLISPSDFIPIAEKSGVILKLGKIILYEACRQGKEWLDIGFSPIKISVNVSSIQFQKEDMNQLCKEVLQETGFPASSLEIELTESGLIGDVERILSILNDIRSQGIKLSIDDFGTGYSSLAYLRKFEIDTLKIDKSFVDDLIESSDARIIAKTIIIMGHTLGLKIIAEGVETQGQLDFLISESCDMYQGYFKSRPVSAIQLEQMLRDQAYLYLQGSVF